VASMSGGPSLRSAARQPAGSVWPLRDTCVIRFPNRPPRQPEDMAWPSTRGNLFR